MNKIILGLKRLDKITYKIIKYGLIFSSFIAIIAVPILILYILSGRNIFYYWGFYLVKSSLAFSVEFIICGIIADSIKKQIT